MTDRRAFLRLVAAGLLASPHAAEAQGSTAPVIGFVRSSSLKGAESFVAAFRQGLEETGYRDGQNVTIELRSAEDQYERLPEIVGGLVRRPVAVLVANATAAQACKAATTTIPIVFATGADPVTDDKLVPSFNRPGGNITGITFLSNSLGPKKLELLRDVIPGTKTLGLLENPKSPPSRSERATVVAAARAIGQHLVVVHATQEKELDGAFDTLVRERAGGLLVTGDALFTSRRDRVLALASRHAIPTIHSERQLVEAGALLSYGTSLIDAYRLVGVYAGRILKGEKPGDLPVIRGTRFEMGVNLKTAKALGITVPATVVARADHLVE